MISFIYFILILFAFHFSFLRMTFDRRYIIKFRFSSNSSLIICKTRFFLSGSSFFPFFPFLLLSFSLISFSASSSSLLHSLPHFINSFLSFATRQTSPAAAPLPLLLICPAPIGLLPLFSNQWPTLIILLISSYSSRACAATFWSLWTLSLL